MTARRMRIRRLDEFSLVDRPANPLARIVLSKRDTTEKLVDQDEKGLLKQLLGLFKRAAEVAVDDKIEKRVEVKDGKFLAYNDAGELVGEFDTEDKARAAAYNKREDDKMPEEQKPETVSKAEVEALTKRLEDAEKRATENAETVATLKREARTAEFGKRAEDYKPLPIADGFATLLMKVADVLTPEENTALDTVLTAGAEAMRKALTEIGSDAPAEGTAEAEVQKAVAELRKQDPKLSEQLARGKVFKSNPELRRKVEAESAAR